MFGHLILAHLHLVAGCASCPCVIVPGENLADPATLVPRARENATAILAGQVVHIDTIETMPSPFPSDTFRPIPRPPVVTRLRYTLFVDRVWKGKVARDVQVVAQTLISSCGEELDLRGRYLIYAAGPRDSLAADGCARVVPWARVAEAELRVLGGGRKSQGSSRRGA
jgi:hypothetical protein